MKQDNTLLLQLKNEVKEWKAKYRKLQTDLKPHKIDSFSVMNAVPTPIIVNDINGNAIYVNLSFKKIFGWSLENLSNNNNFSPDEHSLENRDILNRIRQGEKILSVKTQRFTKDQKSLDVHMTSAIYEDANGITSGSIVMYQVVPQQEKIQALLMESEEKYRSAMEAVADPIIVYDIKGRVSYFNPAFSRVFKWQLEDCIHREMDYFIPEENRSEKAEMVAMVMAGQVFSGMETNRYDKEGKIIPVSISGSPYRDRRHRVVGSIINLQDISERKQAEKELKQKEKLKGALEMAGAVCHELSQPAMIMEGYADIFLMNITKGHPLYQKVNQIKEQVHRIGTLTQKLLNITTYETREYSDGKKIVDIDKASRDPGSPDA